MTEIRPTGSPHERRDRRACALLFIPVLASLLAACGHTGPDAGQSQKIGSASHPAREEPLVNFANFIEQIAPATLPAFTRETGIKVNYDTYELNQVLETRLLAGNSGLDLVVPGNNYLERGIASGVYRKLDKSLLPNLRHLDPAILKKLERNDPGNLYAVPYVWGTTSLGYDATKVEAALGESAPDSWALLFDPDYAAKLAGCGIIISDAPSMMVSLALTYLGRDPNSERPEDLAAAMDVLMVLRPYVREITSSTATRQLVEGEACVAVGPNADFYLARKLAQETARNVDIRYVVPEDAPHPDNAHRLIDYLLRPEVIAEVTTSVGFANANASADPLVPATLRNDPTVYPDAASLQRLWMAEAHSNEFSRKQNGEFTRFRVGQ
jgi:putrescine transport system substrate-binding protein